MGKKLFTMLAIALAMLMSQNQAKATVIAYEGFDIAAPNNTNIDGQAGATSVGFNGNWVTNFDVPSFFTEGLSMTAAPGIGGKLFINDDPERASRQFDITVSGTIYGSFMVRRYTAGGNDNSGIFIDDNPAGITDGNFADSLGWQADGPGNSAAEATLNGAQANNATTAVPTSTTFLFLFEVTGLTNGMTDVAQSNTLWILNDAQLTNYVNTNTLNAPTLNAASNGTGSTQVFDTLSVSNSGTTHINTSSFLTVAGLRSIGSEGYDYDEFRLSNASLFEAATGLVPEPTSAAVFVISALSIIIHRKRERI